LRIDKYGWPFYRISNFALSIAILELEGTPLTGAGENRLDVEQERERHIRWLESHS